MLQYYYSNGFPNATFRYRSHQIPDNSTVELTYQISEGPRQFVRKVIITGLDRTRPSLVDRSIDLQGRRTAVVDTNQ